jgi:hypothetical protein
VSFLAGLGTQALKHQFIRKYLCGMILPFINADNPSNCSNLTPAAIFQMAIVVSFLSF